MLSYSELSDVLDELAEEIPEDIFRELNGGIILLENSLTHPESENGDLYVMGQYHYEPNGMGRYITLYYGSFYKVCRDYSAERLRERLREVLYHELVHHLESMAGDRSLEKKDMESIERYKRGLRQ